VTRSRAFTHTARPLQVRSQHAVDAAAVARVEALTNQLRMQVRGGGVRGPGSGTLSPHSRPYPRRPCAAQALEADCARTASAAGAEAAEAAVEALLDEAEGAGAAVEAALAAAAAGAAAAGDADSSLQVRRAA